MLPTRQPKSSKLNNNKATQWYIFSWCVIKTTFQRFKFFSLNHLIWFDNFPFSFISLFHTNSFALNFCDARKCVQNVDSFVFVVFSYLRSNEKYLNFIQFYVFLSTWHRSQTNVSIRTKYCLNVEQMSNSDTKIDFRYGKNHWKEVLSDWLTSISQKREREKDEIK